MNIKTRIDEWEVRDFEDNSVISVLVEHNTEMGNRSLPGLQVVCAGNFVNYEPLHVQRWAYEAKKTGRNEFLIESPSWMVYEDRFVKHYLVMGDKLKAKVSVKVRSKDKAVEKEYELPFTLED